MASELIASLIRYTASGPEFWAGGKPSKHASTNPDGATQSRHDWAGPGSMILLFNCHGCTFRIADGSEAGSVMGETEDLTVIAMFNMQVRSTALPLLWMSI